MQQSIMFLLHKGEIEENVLSIAKEKMQQSTMYLPLKGEIPQNIAPIAQGRNATKHNVFTAQV